MSDMADHPVTRGPNDDPSISDDELVRRRTEWFAAYMSQKNVYAPQRESQRVMALRRPAAHARAA